ncbi:hypothetical protein ACGTJS_11215 [Faucicola mancuniensis]|uniref:hypothetical protein n=1 Tax=Faucicola mancuniensis TaxID=1309795 RepID=UPI0028E493C0|nr:hypothetical protein [uncultured Moraxella sp.]
MMNTINKLLAVCAMGAMFVPSLAMANTTPINACVAQMTAKQLTDKKSAEKVCTCVAKEQSKVTQAQTKELNNWVQSGKDIRTNKTFQNLSKRIKACGDGVKFNK